MQMQCTIPSKQHTQQHTSLVRSIQHEHCRGNIYKFEEFQAHAGITASGCIHEQCGMHVGAEQGTTLTIVAGRSCWYTILSRNSILRLLLSGAFQSPKVPALQLPAKQFIKPSTVRQHVCKAIYSLRSKSELVRSQLVHKQREYTRPACEFLTC